MRFFLSASVLFLNLFASTIMASPEAEKKIQAYNEHIDEQNSFEKSRMAGLDDFLKSKKTDLSDWEKQRQQYIEDRKKDLAQSVSSETGPHFKEFMQEKNKFEEERALIYRQYQTDKEKIKAEDNSKKMLAFRLKELGLDKDSELNRVDPKKRKWANTVPGSARGSSGGGGGGGGGSSGGYSVPPMGGLPMGGMDEMDPPPPPDFDEGDSISVPPVPAINE